MAPLRSADGWPDAACAGMRPLYVLASLMRSLLELGRSRSLRAAPVDARATKVEIRHQFRRKATQAGQNRRIRFPKAASRAPLLGASLACRARRRSRLSGEACRTRRRSRLSSEARA